MGNGYVFAHEGHPAWTIILSVFCIAMSPIATYWVVAQVRHLADRRRRVRRMWRELNEISRGGHMRERARV